MTKGIRKERKDKNPVVHAVVLTGGNPLGLDSLGQAGTERMLAFGDRKEKGGCEQNE
jgi:hypothetical protein